MAVIAGHPVTPSDQVDQVWHLHLTYSRSYWEDFCPNVLHMPLHHGPTQGGESEQAKFQDWYGKTLNSYEVAFGQKPPEDIWPAPAIRFGRNGQFVRVDRSCYWILPKFRLANLSSGFFAPAKWLVISAILLFLTGCVALPTTDNPLDFSGSQFLLFYSLLSISVVAVSMMWRRRLRLPDTIALQDWQSCLDIYDIAYLVEGVDRVVESAIAKLVTQGNLKINAARQSISSVPFDVQPEGLHPIEQQILDVVGQSAKLSDVISQLKSQVQPIHQRLEGFGLATQAKQARKAQFYPMLPFSGLVLLGFAKIQIGLIRDRPVGFLVILTFLMMCVGLGFLFTPAYRSRAGDRLIDEQKREYQSSDIAGDNRLKDFSYALFGASSLSGSELIDLKNFLHPPSSGGDGGSGGDSGCSGGCGGCGGCGG